MATNPTLPGVRVSLSEVFYTANDANPDAARVLIIATPAAASAIVAAGLYNPVKYGSEQQVLNACGAGSPAHVAYVQALRSGAKNIYVSCVDPTKVSTVLERETELQAALDFADMVEPDIIVAYGFYANEVYAGTAGPDIVKNITAVPTGAEGDTVVTITATAHGFAEGDVVTLLGLTPAFLNEAKVIQEIVSVNKFIVSTKEATPAYTLTAGDVAAFANAGGTATKDTTTGARICANAKNLGTKCHQLMRDLNPCIGVIAMQPIAQDAPTAAQIAAYTEEVTGAKVLNLAGVTALPAANVVEDVKAVTIDAVVSDVGKYLCLCAGKVLTSGQPASSTDPWLPVLTSCEAVVAGKIYETPLESAITSSPITNVVSLSNNFSRAQKLAFVTAKVNPVCLNSSSQIITLDGWTLASEDSVTGAASVYERLSTVRIVNEVVKSVRNELEKFIGMQASTARLNSIETKLRTLLNAFKAAGVLRNAEFKIQYSQSTGTLTVDLVLVPFGEMRTVEVTVSVKINA